MTMHVLRDKSVEFIGAAQTHIRNKQIDVLRCVNFILASSIGIVSMNRILALESAGSVTIQADV